MKKTEINFKEGQGEIKLEHDRQPKSNPMTADQKYKLGLAAIVCVAFVAAVLKLGIVAVLVGGGVTLILALAKFMDD